MVNAYRQEYKVHWRKRSYTEIKTAVMDCLIRYDKTNSTQIKNDLDEITSSAQKDEIVSKLIRYLLNWNHRTFVYNRRQSLKTLYEACINFKQTEKRQFKETLDAYFTIDALTLDLEKIIPLSSSECVEQAKSYLITVDEKQVEKIHSVRMVERIQSSLARYLESYQDNPGLNLLSGLCRLITDSFEDMDGSSRLVSYLKLAQLNIEEWDTCFETLLKFIKLLPKEKVDLFANTVMPHLSNSVDLAIMHELLDHSSSGIAYLETVNARLEATFR